MFLVMKNLRHIIMSETFIRIISMLYCDFVLVNNLLG